MLKNLLKPKTKVIIDTNFLLLPGSKGFDVFSKIKNLLAEPHTLCVVQASEFELKQIMTGNTKASGKDKFNAKLGLIMIKQQGLKVLKNSLKDGYADKVILENLEKTTIVATLDKDLKAKVLEKGNRIITFQQGKLVLKV